ncbi:MAG: hypothetical protein ACRC32_04265 [Chroococcidiopsis sp.]
MNQLVTGLRNETALAAQIIQRLQPALQQQIQFSNYQHQIIDYLSTFVLGETALAEFSHGQDLLIDMLAGMLADPVYILYWAFELWCQSKLTPEFMEVLSQAYLKLSELNPLPGQQTPTEADALKRIAQMQQQVNSNPSLQPQQPQQQQPMQTLPQVQQDTQTQQLQQMQQLARQQNGFQRPAVPAPPIPAQNGAAQGWNGVRQNMQQGNILQALRSVDTLSPQDWREMFNN